MIVEIEHKKLGDIQILTYRHVRLCENLHAMRSCKSKVA